MPYSIPRSALVLAVAVGLAACSDATSPPDDQGTVIEHVITEAVVADVGESVVDASDRILPTVPDHAFVVELDSYLDAMNHYIAERDVYQAERSLLQAKAVLARPGLSVEVQDSAMDLAVVALVLDQTQALIDAALGREM